MEGVEISKVGMRDATRPWCWLTPHLLETKIRGRWVTDYVRGVRVVSTNPPVCTIMNAVSKSKFLYWLPVVIHTEYSYLHYNAQKFTVLMPAYDSQHSIRGNRKS